MIMPTDIEAWIRGLTLLPIFVCSVVGFGLTLTKWVQLRRSRRAADRLLPQVRPLISDADYARALAIVHGDHSFAARLIEQALTAAGASRRRLTGQVERAGQQIAQELNHGVGGIGLIATLGPLLGLFGTVVGIVVVFDRLSAAEGLVSPSQLAGGIGTALYTTVAGLIVGMCALVSHRFLAGMSSRATTQLEAIGQELVDLIAEDDS